MFPSKPNQNKEIVKSNFTDPELSHHLQHIPKGDPLWAHLT